MKKLVFILSIALVLGLATLSSANPFAYYPFNGTANDASGNGYNGTVNGAVLTTDRFGKASSAYSFDGINDYISIPEFLSADIPAVTITAWVKPSNVHNGTIFYKGLLGEMTLRSNSAGTYDMGVKLSDKSWFFTGGAMDTGKFQFIAGTYYKDNKIEIWVDGVLANSTNITNHDLFYGVLSSSIGSYNQATDGFFNGIIDDVAVYDYGLSATEIQKLANQVPEPTSMLLLGLGLLGLVGARRKCNT